MKFEYPDSPRRSEITPQAPTPPTAPTAPRLVSCPFVVLVDDEPRDSFYDVRDAVFAARELQRAAPGARVTVTDTRTGRLLIEVGD
jgi:hypothetical protein